MEHRGPTRFFSQTVRLGQNYNMKLRRCCIEWCNRFTVAKNYCKKHYEYYLKKKKENKQK